MTNEDRVTEVRKGHARGWRFTPLYGKRPHLKKWQSRRPADLETSVAYAHQGNVGLRTGRVSGIVVLDCDDGADIEALNLPQTPTVITGGGGKHFYFSLPNGMNVRNGAGRIAPCVDVRGEGGYAVFVGSVHPDTGKPYRWADGLSADDVPLAPFPEHLLARLTEKTSAPDAPPIQDLPKYTAAVLQGECEAVRNAPEGARNDTLNKAAFAVGTLLHTGEIDRQGVSQALAEAGQAAGLSEEEARATIESGLSAGEQRPRDVPNPEDSRLPVCHPILQTSKRETNSLTRGRFNLKPLSELMSQPEETTEWVVDGLLPVGGLSVLAGKPKAGKSTLARDLALNVAKDTLFLDRATLQGPVLYFALEEKESEVRNHFRDMGVTGAEPIFIHAAPVDVTKTKEELGKAIREYKPVLVIVDTLFRFTTVKDNNDYMQVTRALNFLLDLAREAGTHIMCVHHLGKGDRRGAEGLLGSTAIRGTADTILLLEGSKDRRFLSSEQRYGKGMEERELVLDEETRTFSLGGTRRERTELDIQERLTRYLKEQDGPVSEEEIMRNVTGDLGTKRKALRMYCEAGIVQRTGEGKKGKQYEYRIVV